MQANCYLTERQKEMLAVLLDGLKEGFVKSDWLIAYYASVERITDIFGMDDKDKLPPQAKSLWETVTIDDFHTFVECGLMSELLVNQNGLHTTKLFRAKIINFVENSSALNTKSQDNSNVIEIRGNTVFGSPQADSQYKCDVFVIMPFASNFTPIYTDHLKPTVEKMGYSIKRGDDFFSKRSIMSDVWSAMISADVVMADCSGRNPNVFYELGMAHTLNKSVIMLTQNIEDIPFDIRHLRIITYQYTPRGMNELEINLEDAIKKLLNKKVLLRRLNGETPQEFILRALALKGLTRADLAERLKLRKVSIDQLLDAQYTPKVDITSKLANILDIHLQDLIQAYLEN